MEVALLIAAVLQAWHGTAWHGTHIAFLWLSYLAGTYRRSAAYLPPSSAGSCTTVFTSPPAQNACALVMVTTIFSILIVQQLSRQPQAMPVLQPGLAVAIECLPSHCCF